MDAMVVFGPPNLRAKKADPRYWTSGPTSVEIGNVLDTTHVNGPLRVNVVATAPARGRQAWTVPSSPRRRPPRRRAHLAVGLGLDKTRRVEHFSVISRSDGATRRGALLRQTSWVLRFKMGKQPLLCAENGDASVDGRDAFRASPRQAKMRQPSARGTASTCSRTGAGVLPASGIQIGSTRCH